TRVLGRQVDRARRCADGHRAVFGDGEGSARPHRRVQAVRGAGVANHDRALGCEAAVRFMTRAPRARLVFVFALAALPTACSRAHVTETSGGGQPSPAASPVASLELEYDQPAVVGATAHATASGLEAGKTVDLGWGTATGGWVIEDYYHFRGKKYAEATASLGRFPVGGDGRLSARFAIPEDYGGVHEVIARVDGKPVAQGAINVSQTFVLSPSSGP